MLTASKNKKPTEAELNILGVIWELEKATVREVFDHLNTRQNIGYTTVLKLMQIMTDKGFLKRYASVRPQIYQAASPRQRTQKLLLKDIMDQAFNGLPGPMVLQALSIKQSTPGELQQIRDMLDALEQENES